MRVFFQVHRWAGVVAALLVGAQAVTGTALVFRHELARLFSGRPPASADEGTASFADVLASVRGRFPQHRVDRAIFPRTERDLYVFRLRPAGGGLLDIATVDARTGAILNVGGLLEFPTEALLFIHAELLAGETGRRVVGAMGASALVLVITGAYLWWPGRRRWRRALTVHLHAPLPRLIDDLHQVTGALSVPTLAVLTFTGTIVALKADVRPWVGRLLPVEGAADLTPPAAPPGARPISIDVLIAGARKRFPGQRVRDVRFSGERVVGVLFYDHGNPQPRAVDQVWLDDRTGQVLAVMAARDEPGGDRFLNWMLPIHSGEWLGPAGRALVQVTGLALLLLAVTGPWLALARFSARRRAAVFLARREAGTVPLPAAGGSPEESA